MAKRATKRKRKNLFGFGKRETYHARIIRTGTASAKKPRPIRYLGTRIIPLSSGKFTVAFDQDSHFDDLKTAKAFVKSWKKNPAKFDRCVKKVAKSLKKRGKPGNAYAICKASGVKNKRSARARAKISSRNRKPRKAPTTKRHGNPATLLWNASQGPATADVYMMKMSGKNRFEVDLANDSHKHTYKATTFDEAKAIARQKLHEFASNPGGASVVPGADYADSLVRAGHRVLKGVAKAGKKLVKHLGKRKNPVDVATKRYEEFHGYPVNELVEVESREHRHSVTYGIGQLVALEMVGSDQKPLPVVIAPGFAYKQTYWDFNPKTPAAKVVWLTAGEDNKQLLLDGGDQSLDLKALGFTERDYHDYMLIGEIVRVWYRTRKKFEGDEEVDFYHEFGKEGSRGVRPVLNYRPKNPSLEIVGGRYEIALPDKSIGGVSPGIVG